MSTPSTEIPGPLNPSQTTSIDELLYHARIIDPWIQPDPGDGSDVQHSFFGLDLELHGFDENITTIQELQFTRSRVQRSSERLDRMRGPFELKVKSKMASEFAIDTQRQVLQALAPVQCHNQLVQLNKIHFLDDCTTGIQVYRALERVLDHVSVGKPFELTFLRHNHAAASAKIVPFASRLDVQTAQIAQFAKLHEAEAQWTNEKKQRKQFLLQQMDWTREAYLHSHIGLPLHHLHEGMMKQGHWQAYEYDKVLWYYHAPTKRLFAEHPMRNDPETRLLIGSVQLRTRFAAIVIQRSVRIYLKHFRLITNVLSSLINMLGDVLWNDGVNMAWEGILFPFYLTIHNRLKSSNLAEQLWHEWITRHEEEQLYHIRLLDKWIPPPNSPDRSLFGLTLQLQGFKTNTKSEPVTITLEFQSSISPAFQIQLHSIFPPFQVIVDAKQPLDNTMSESQKIVMQAIVSIQIGNQLEQINKMYYLQQCESGADVYNALERVRTRVGVGKPFELTFRRHNHAAASAKIVPFASRLDVQTAQIAQFAKLHEAEAQWTNEKKQRKQFLLQQMDWTREAYLHSHIGLPLHHLHEEMMKQGHWQAYEYDKVLWYYHAPTKRLFAEHPMRNDPETRLLIGSVQLRTRFAAIVIQRSVRRCIKRRRVMEDMVETLVSLFTDEYWAEGFSVVWNTEIESLYTQLAVEYKDLSIIERTDELWKWWISRKREVPHVVTVSVEPTQVQQIKDVVTVSGESTQAPLIKDVITVSVEPMQVPPINTSIMVQPIRSKTPPVVTIPVVLICPPDPVAESPIENESHDRCDSDEELSDWRRHLRLLKAQHPMKRSFHQKRENNRSCILPTQSPLFPQLDHSSVEDEIDAAISCCSTDALTSLSSKSSSPTWHRNGSFRTFHAFFASDVDPTTSISSTTPKHKTLSSSKQTHKQTTTLPPPFPSMVSSQEKASDEVKTRQETHIIPKKLPYIRRKL